MVLVGMNLVSGSLMGMAGSLHCAGVCGGIASSLLLAISPAASRRTRSGVLLKTQIGRAVSYTLCGALVGCGGSAFAGLLALADAQQVLRVMAAAMIVWTGCSVAGLGRGFPAMDQALTRIATGLPNGSRGVLGHPVALGMIWGFAPCGMVYAALLNAMMTGSAGEGAQFMAGFSLGTLPSVAVTAFGVSAVARRGIRLPERATIRRALGTSIVVLGVISLAEPASSLASLCLGH